MPLKTWICIASVGFACLPGHGRPGGTSMQGMTGGLVVPTAHVLPEHAMSVSYGNYQEPRFGSNIYQRNMLFGVGVLKNVEVFARFADYTDTPYGEYLERGPRDLSANIKARIPFLPERGPQIAFGKTDLAGDNVVFQSTYGVVTQQWRTLSASLGYVRQSANSRDDGFEGIFGGLEWRLDPTGISLLAEHDGRNAHAGGRWQSPSLQPLGGLQLGATLQHSFGAAFKDGSSADDLRFAVNAHLPLAKLDARRKNVGASAAVKPEAIPANDTEPPPEPARVEDLAPLRHALEAAGLERVRVGLHGDPAHPELVVEYENHRYAQNEVDALGLVLGLGSDRAPAAVRHIRAITLKDGLAVHETRVHAPTWRAFLRHDPSAAVRDSLTWRSGKSGAARAAEWERDAPSQSTRVRLVIRPDLNQTLGTEVGAFDYSLAAEPALIAPLWAGARATAAYSIPVHHTPNIDNVGVFNDLRQPAGLKTVSLGQSFRMSRWVLAHAAVGRFHHQSWGAQSELRVFVPGTSDIVRARGALYHADPGRLEGGDKAGAVSYRRLWSPVTWTEIGWQLYGDGTAGPTLEWTRWASDVAVTFFARQGGQDRFIGMTLTVPLTPRRGMMPHAATVAGPAHHAQGIRTMVGSSTGANLVRPTWVRELRLEADIDGELLNGGRMSEAYLRSQAYRLREAFYVYSGRE